jgi:fatty acid desaturase
LTHIQHHRHAGRRLTEVGHDPESFYLPAGHLLRVGRIRRAILRANCTLAGRLTFGPALAMITFWSEELRHARADRRRRRIWMAHALGAAAVLAWVSGVCHISPCVYVLLVVYPSMSLTHLRSFAEHRVDDHSKPRTNVVEANPFWGLIFLNNNLHVAHHAHPQLPWHELPHVWRDMRRANVPSGQVFNGYSQVAREYFLRPFITAEHPFSGVEAG